ncbi:MAG: NTP transferase domain-containing protein [Bifidobacteriaceae bacterium]|jgi:CTP:phosphocholine cytidylyltransferase-like protein/thiamine kinase-like enzyme|nr:NTP transferase domain-containing protein [Bifidobacteriaceae bacterium]
MLNHPEFAVLSALAQGEAKSQRQLARTGGIALGAVNAALRRLREQGYVDGLEPTAAGLAALAPHKVDNAVILAAGLSTRFAPISYERPKGLLVVKGEVLIERLIRQLQAAGIGDITVVVGYKLEQFLYLEDAFGVEIAVNRDYETRNNHSSLKVVERKLGNTYICSSDNYYERNVFSPYVHRGYYAAVWNGGPTDEWAIEWGGFDRITRAAPGGRDCWVMLGEAYFDRAFSNRFRQILNRVYNDPATPPKLWEAIYADHIGELDLRVRRYGPDVVHEFDSLDDVRAFDRDFLNNIDSSILENICSTLGVRRDDLSSFEPIPLGLSNLSFRFDAGGQSYVYRHPGVAGQGIINRRAEAEAEAVALDLGLDRSFIHLDPAAGWKLSRFIATTTAFDYHNPAHVAKALGLARQLHTSGRVVSNDFDLYRETAKIKARLERGGPEGAGRRLGFADFAELDARATRLYNAARADGVGSVLCHGDFYDPNILIQGRDMYLIDWEYSGMSDYAADLGTFVCCSDYTYDQALKVLEVYFGREPTADELRHCVSYIALAAHYWFVWALHKDACGEPVGEYLYLWYRFAKDYGERAEALRQPALARLASEGA